MRYLGLRSLDAVPERSPPGARSGIFKNFCERAPPGADPAGPRRPRRRRHGPVGPLAHVARSRRTRRGRPTTAPAGSARRTTPTPARSTQGRARSSGTSSARWSRPAQGPRGAGTESWRRAAGGQVLASSSGPRSARSVLPQVPPRRAAEPAASGRRRWLRTSLPLGSSPASASRAGAAEPAASGLSAVRWTLETRSGRCCRIRRCGSRVCGGGSLAAPGWWRQPPFLPLPAPGYLRSAWRGPRTAVRAGI